MKYLNKTYSKTFVVLLMSIGLIFSCSDLEINETDSILAANFDGLSPEQASSSLDNMYNSYCAGLPGDPKTLKNLKKGNCGQKTLKKT